MFNQKIDEILERNEYLKDQVENYEGKIDEIVKKNENLKDQVANCEGKIDMLIDLLKNKLSNTSTIIKQTEDVVKKNSDLQPLEPERHIEANSNLNSKVFNEKSRTRNYPKSNVTRADVPDDKVSWSTNWPEYKPIEYTSELVLSNPNADNTLFSPKIEFNIVDKLHKVDRSSFFDKYDVVNGLPVNPCGRTGITGRGSLNFWGPNHAVEAIITRLLFEV